MKKHLWMRLLSVLLCIALITQPGTYVVLAETQESVEQPTENTHQIIGEQIEKRTANEKYFLYDDHSIVAAVYPNAVHYQDADGNWQDIDNRLIESEENGESQLSNTAGAWNIKFAKKAKDGKPAKLKYGNHNIKWYLEGAQKTEGTIHPTATVDSQEPYVLEGITSGMLYEDILENVDLEYRLQGDQIKENLILKSATAAGEYSFVYETGALEMKLQDNILVLLDGEEQLLTLAAPVMNDAAGEDSYDITLSLQTIKATSGNHQYRITVSPDMTWLTDPERVYPVKIDPTLSTEQTYSAIQDTYLDSAAPTTNRASATTVKVGMNGTSKVYRGLIKFALPSAITETDRVVAAYLQVCPYSDSTDYETMALQKPVIEAHALTSDWTYNTVTWNTQPGYNSTVLDYDIVQAESGSTAFRWYSWDITDLVDQWYTTGNNTGIMLKYDNETSYGSNMVCNFVSADNSAGAGYYPVVTMQYMNMLGLENYWTYHTLDAGDAGTVYINDFTGSTTIVTPLAYVASERMPLDISLVYTPGSDNSAINHLETGANYMLNVQSYVEAVSINSVTKYKYVDSDGTIHYFGETNGVWKDESGLGLTLELGTQWIITDKQDNKLYYQAHIGRLSKIEDNCGNYLQMSYTAVNGKYYLSSVTNGTHTATLTRDSSNRLSRITFPGSGSSEKYTEISYTEYNNNISNIKTYVTEQDTAQVQSHVRFGVSGQRIIYVIDEMREIYYTLSHSNQNNIRRVTQISRLNYQQNSETLYTTAITYGKRSTQYVTTLPDGTKKRELYTFNTLGQTITAQDEAGNAVYQQYGLSGGAKNKVTFASDSQSPVKNLVINHNFEKSLASSTLPDWQLSGNSKDKAIVKGTADSEPTYIGNQALKVFKSSATQTANALSLQYVYLEGGKTYTLSGYVKAALTTIGDVSGAGAIIGVENADSSMQFMRDGITGTDFTRYYITIDLTGVTGAQYYKVYCGIKRCRGSAYFDCIQLEEGGSVNPYNLLENAGFENSSDTASWTTVATTSSDLFTTLAGYNGTSTGVYRLAGSPKAAKKIYQSITLSGSAGDSFSAGVWIKTNTVPNKDVWQDGTRQSCSVTLELDRASGSSQYVSCFLDSANDEWRYVSLGAVAEFDYTAVKLYLKYPYNCNYTYFDDATLFLDAYGQSYTYDDDGNLISVTDKANVTQSTVIGDNNDVDSYTDGMGNTYTFEYNNGDTTSTKHQLTKVTYPAADSSSSSTTVSTTYDSYGNATSTTTRNGSLSASSHTTYSDDGHHVATTEDSTGAIVYYERDDTTGQLNDTFSPVSGNITLNTSYTYDSVTEELTDISVGKQLDYGPEWVRGELTELPTKVSYTYDRRALEEITRYNGTTLEMGYYMPQDAFGRTTGVYWYGKDCDLYSLQQTDYYDGLALPRTVTYGNGHHIDYIYNSVGQLLQRSYNDTPVTGYDYNANNALGSSWYLNTTTGKKVYTHYFYDLAGRLAEVESDTGYSLGSIAYDLNNRITSYRSSLQDGLVDLSYNTYYTYNNVDSLTQMLLKPTGGNGSGTIRYTYDGLQRLTQKQITINSTQSLTQNITYVTSDNGATTLPATVSYSSNETNSGSPLFSESYSYTYDDRGHLLSETYAKGSSTKQTLFTYDTLGQLTGWENASEQRAYNYTYDAGGNLTGQTKTGSGDLTEYASAYTYDSDISDLLVKYEKYHYASGSSTSPQSIDRYTYTYNTTGGNNSFVNPLTINRQTLASDGTTVTGSETWNLSWREGRTLQSMTLGSRGTVSFVYNEDGLRTQQTHLDGSKSYYHYNGSLLEYIETVNSAGTLTNLLRFIYDSNGQVQYLLHKNSNFDLPESFDLYYYFRDGSGAITQLVKTRAATSTGVTAAFEIAAQYTYDPYGDLEAIIDTNGSGLCYINPLRYKDYIYDTDTGWYYLQSRYYDPQIGRFINGDCAISSVGKDILGYNIFTYCMNNPVNMSDPTGNWPQWLKNAVKWVAQNVVRPAVSAIQNTLSKIDATYSKGINISGSPSAFIFNLQAGISVDTKGNVAIQGSAGGGVTGGSPGASLTAYQSITNAPSIKKLEGPGYQLGGSVATPLALGSDFNIIPDDNLNTTYFGITKNVGIGTPGGEFHVAWGNTASWEITQFNIYEMSEKIYIKIMEW